MVRGDQKLVRAAGEDGTVEWRYYDLAADPGETRPLSPEEAGAGALRLKERLQGLLKSRVLDRKRGGGRGGTLSEEEIAELRRLGYL